MNIIIGAGLAGLACARTLIEAGVDPGQVRVLDRAPTVGGRVSTLAGVDAGQSAATGGCEGYVLDRGFQVLLSSYPTARKLLDFDALDMCWFDSGALMVDDSGKLRPWYAPTRHPIRGLASFFSGVLSRTDQLRLAKLMVGWVVCPDKTLINRLESQSLGKVFKDKHLSDRCLEMFLRPFYGGVLLDDNLRTSAALGALYGKRFVLGRAGVPRRGMAEIPRQLASQLPAGVLQTGVQVESIRRESGQVLVCIEGGGELRGGQVVLATDPWSSAKLLALEPPAAREVMAVYLSSDKPLYPQRLLLLLPGKGRWIRHLVQISNINPAAAPNRKHLLCATILGNSSALDDSAVIKRTLHELSEVFPEKVKELSPLAVVRVPYAIPEQDPGWLRRRSQWLQACPSGIVLAGDVAANASIEGALSSGVTAAKTLLGRCC